MKLVGYLFALSIVISGCGAPLQWNPVTKSAEKEYQPYLVDRNATITGQAFLKQRGGGVVTAAGNTVTLDPATSIGNEWWKKAGLDWYKQSEIPPSTAFTQARRTTIADADGRFKFPNLSQGKYYVCTMVTWDTGGDFQGGFVGQLVEVQDGESKEVILTR